VRKTVLIVIVLITIICFIF